ncbi:MAG: hypothetical protein APF84_18830 [Gracilibacter sp. BRH_c7a]|nr:MAG: hypothetical protein APF84_18830 [Gracilibacter sp. BRH_c7a]
MDISSEKMKNILLFVNRDSNMPLYLQVKEQIKYMILTKRLNPDNKFPSSRQLANFLHINRATINNALNELENEGYLQTEKGIGIRVSACTLERDHEKFNNLIIDSIAKAEQIGFTKEEFVTGTFVLAHHRDLRNSQDDFYTIFVECNEPVLNGYKKDLEDSLNIRVEPVLIDSLINMDYKTQRLVQNSSMVITTFTHLHEVRTLLKDIDIEIIGVTAGPYLELLFRLSTIEFGQKIAVIMVTDRGAVEVAQSIKDSGVKHSQIMIASFENKEKLIETVKGAHLIVASNAVVAEVKKHTNTEQDIMTYYNSLDSASKNMLQKVISECHNR